MSGDICYFGRVRLIWHENKPFTLHIRRSRSTVYPFAVRIRISVRTSSFFGLFPLLFLKRFEMKRSIAKVDESIEPLSASVVQAANAAGIGLPEPRVSCQEHTNAAKRARVYSLVAALLYRTVQFAPDVEPNFIFREKQQLRSCVVRMAEVLQQAITEYNDTPVEQRRNRFGKRGDPNEEFNVADALRLTKTKPALTKLAFGMCGAAKLWPTLWLKALPQVEGGQQEDKLLMSPGIFDELAEFPEEVQRVERVWRDSWGITD